MVNRRSTTSHSPLLFAEKDANYFNVGALKSTLKKYVDANSSANEIDANSSDAETLHFAADQKTGDESDLRVLKSKQQRQRRRRRQ